MYILLTIVVCVGVCLFCWLGWLLNVYFSILIVLVSANNYFLLVFIYGCGWWGVLGL